MHISVIIALIICLAIAIVLLLTFIGMFRKKNRNTVAMTLVLILAVIITATPFIIGETARAHGMQPDSSLSEMFEGLRLSPTEDTLPDNIDGAIIIYYRFDCDDCHAVYPLLSPLTRNMENVYWVCSRSEQGRQLLKSYSVSSVPTAIYITKDKSMGDYFAFKLDTKDENGDVTLDTDNWETAVKMQQNGV